MTPELEAAVRATGPLDDELVRIATDRYGRAIRAAGIMGASVGARTVRLRIAERVEIHVCSTPSTQARVAERCPHRSTDYPELACVHNAGHDGACQSTMGGTGGSSAPCCAVRPDGVESPVHSDCGGADKNRETVPLLRPPTPPDEAEVVRWFLHDLKEAMARQHYQQRTRWLQEDHRRAISHLLSQDRAPFATARRAAVMAYCEGRPDATQAEVEALLAVLQRYEDARGGLTRPRPEAWRRAVAEIGEAVLEAYERGRRVG